MEQIIATLITAVVTLIVALIAVGPALKSTGESMRHHAESLSKEHQGLKENLKSGKDTLRQDINNVAKMMGYLRDAQIREDERRRSLVGQNIDVQKTIDLLIGQQHYIGELEQTVKQLREELQSYKDRYRAFESLSEPALQSGAKGSEVGSEPEA